MKEVTSREAFFKFKPESCVFVIANDENGNPSGMIAGFNMKCSMDPPLYAVSLSKNGHTHKLIQKTKEFVIAVPNKDLIEEIEIFGSKHGNEIDKFEHTQIKTQPAKNVKCPLIKDATINFECKLVNEIEVGDHIMFIGEILTSYINDEKGILLYMDKIDEKRIFKEF